MSKWATPYTRPSDVVGFVDTTQKEQSVSISVAGSNYGQIAGGNIVNQMPAKRSLLGASMDVAELAVIKLVDPPIEVGHISGHPEAREFAVQIWGNLRQIGIPVAETMIVSAGVDLTGIVVASLNIAQDSTNPMWMLATWFQRQGMNVTFIRHAQTNNIIVGPQF